MNNLLERVLHLTGWRQLAGCLIAGALASLALPPFGIVPLALALSYPALADRRGRRLRLVSSLALVDFAVTGDR